MDFKFLKTKIGIWVFSALISIAPIAFMGIKDLSNQKQVLNISKIYDYVISSADIIYSLVTLSTIVLADVLCDIIMEKKENPGMIFLYCLAHIATIVFGVLIYALYKMNEINATNMKAINVGSLYFILILSLLSYLNLATAKIKGE